MPGMDAIPGIEPMPGIEAIGVGAGADQALAQRPPRARVARTVLILNMQCIQKVG